MSGTGETLSRNAPCPCGSGKKYKHCCLGKPIAPSKTKTRIAIATAAAVVVAASLTVSWYVGLRAAGFVALIGASALVGYLIFRQAPPPSGRSGADRIDFGR